MLVISALITGLGLGSMYGLLALGFYITYAVSATVNFSQGSSMMLGAVFAYVVRRHARVGRSWPPCCMSLALCAALRPRRSSGSPCGRSCGAAPNAWLMATVALGIVADNAVLFTFGKEPRGFPMPRRIGGVDPGLRRRRVAAAARHSRRRPRPCRAAAASVQPPHAPGQGHARGGAEPRTPRSLMGINVPPRDRRAPSRSRRCSPAPPAC